MASEIDPSVIRDDRAVDKSDLRNQLQIASDEITALQQSTSLIRRMMTDESLFDTL